MHFGDANVRTELAHGDVFGTITFDIAIVWNVFASGEVVQRPAVHWTGEATLHAGAERIDVLRVKLVGPRRFLIVFRSHRPEHSRWFIEKRRAALFQRVLDDRGAQQLLGDFTVALLMRVGGREVGAAALDENRF